MKPSNFLCYRRVAPPVDLQGHFAHTEYVDNFLAISQRPEVAQSVSQEVASALRQSGLPVHAPTCGTGAVALGWSFHALRPSIGASQRSMWRMRLGLLELVRRGSATGRQISIVTGHYTFRALIRRELLACLSATYAFTHSCWDQRTRLWPSVKGS